MTIEKWDLKEEIEIKPVEEITAGDGYTFPAVGDMCSMHYIGSLSDGTVFDSSHGRGPFTFQIGIGEVTIL